MAKPGVNKQIGDVMLNTIAYENPPLLPLIVSLYTPLEGPIPTGLICAIPNKHKDTALLLGKKFNLLL